MQKIIRDAGSIPGSVRSPGGGHGNLLQWNPVDRGAWRATVHRVTKNQTRLKQLSTHTGICLVPDLKLNQVKMYKKHAAARFASYSPFPSKSSMQFG